MTRRPILIVGLVLLALGVASADEQWAQFRGAKSGIATDDPVLPDTWSPTENIVWKVDLPGRGWSSPVVWGDHVFITAAVNTKGSDESLKPVPAYTARSFGGPMSGRDIRRTATRRKHRSPTASACTRISATSGCSRST